MIDPVSIHNQRMVRPSSSSKHRHHGGKTRHHQSKPSKNHDEVDNVDDFEDDDSISYNEESSVDEDSSDEDVSLESDEDEDHSSSDEYESGESSSEASSASSSSPPSSSSSFVSGAEHSNQRGHSNHDQSHNHHGKSTRNHRSTHRSIEEIDDVDDFDEDNDSEGEEEEEEESDEEEDDFRADGIDMDGIDITDDSESGDDSGELDHHRLRRNNNRPLSRIVESARSLVTDNSSRGNKSEGATSAVSSTMESIMSSVMSGGDRTAEEDTVEDTIDGTIEGTIEGTVDGTIDGTDSRRRSSIVDSMRSSSRQYSAAQSLATESASSSEILDDEEDIETAIMEEMGMEKERGGGSGRHEPSGIAGDRHGSNNNGYLPRAMNGNTPLHMNGAGGIPLRPGGVGGYNYNHLSASKAQPSSSMMKSFDLNGISTTKYSDLKPSARESSASGGDGAGADGKKHPSTTKLMKIKMWDPGDPNGRPTTVTVAMKVPNKSVSTGQRRNAFNPHLANNSLGAGQRIHLRLRDVPPSNAFSRNSSDGGYKEKEPTMEIWQPPDESDDKTSNSDFMQGFRIPEKEILPEEEIHHHHLEESKPPVDLNSTLVVKKRNSNATIISEITTDNTAMFAQGHGSGNIRFGNPNPHNLIRSSPFGYFNASNTLNNANHVSNEIDHNHNTNTAADQTDRNAQATTNKNNPIPAKSAEEPPPKPLDPFTIPKVHTTTIVKETPNQKVGLAFRKSTTNTVLIEKIMPGSVFDGTAMKAGHECLSINGHRVRSARKAAEIVRESDKKLTLVVSSAARPPGTMYTMIPIGAGDAGGGKRTGADPHESPGEWLQHRAHAVGMHFKMKQGLVQLVKIDSTSPVGETSMKVGDFILTINGSAVATVSDAVKLLYESENDEEDLIPILYFNMRQLRVSLVDKVIGDLWKKDWSEAYDECVVLEPGGSSKPLTLKFNEEGRCELLDPLRAFRVSDEPIIPLDHPLNSVMDTLNHGIICVLAAIRQGLELAAGGGEEWPPEEKNDDGVKRVAKSVKGNLDQLSKLYSEGLLNKEDFEAIKTRLLS